MDFYEISGIDQGYRVLRRSREEEDSAANNGKEGGETPMGFKRHSAKDILPGFSPKSKIRKADDRNLSPFHICNSRTIQYGDTSIISVFTDDPSWSAGECKSLSKYEGRFRRKPYIMISKVRFRFLSHNHRCHF